MYERAPQLSSAPIRVLVITAYPAAPLSHGGRVRTFRLATGLVGAGAEVDLVCPWSPGQPRRSYRWEGVRIRPQLFPTLPLLALPDDWLPSALPVSWEAPLPRAAALLREAPEYDVVEFEASGHGPWLERLPRGVGGVYGSHNVDADFAHRRVDGAGPLKRRLAAQVSRLERRAVRASDLVLACTQEDARRFEELYGDTARCAVIPNGFDDRLLSIDRPRLREGARASLGLRPEERVLLFVGGAAHHNLRAVRSLELEVVPRVDGPVRLVVAGKAGEALSGEDPRAVRVGYVADLRPLLAAADVGLNPVAYGSGSNLKVPEYLAAGLPVVTTPVGARGFERWAGAMHVAELADFPDAVASLPPPVGPPPGIEELAWSGIGRRLYATYAELIRSSSSASAISS